MTRKVISNDASCRGNYKYKRKLRIFAVGEGKSYCDVTPSGEARVSVAGSEGAERRRGGESLGNFGSFVSKRTPAGGDKSL